MGLTLEQILNTKDGMTAIRDNEKNVTRPDIVAGSEWLEFYGTEVKTLSIDGNTGISFNDTGIKDMRICGLNGTAVFGVYRQEAELWNGTRFLKIRVEMYNSWYFTFEIYRVIYELFFYDNGIIFVNIPKTPDSASLIGESHIRKPDGTLVALTVANKVKPENPAYITIKNPFSESQEIRYEKYDPYQATGILISELPLKTEYYRYAETDFGGLEVKWTDETGYMRACQNYTMSECSTEEPGTQIITVTAGGFTAEFEITVLETAITGIRVTPPIKTKYGFKEEIDLTGIKVEYILSNGQFEETQKYQVSDFDNEFIGTQSLTVTHGRFSDSFDVTIKSIMEFQIGAEHPEDIIAVLDSNTGIMTVTGTGAIRNGDIVYKEGKSLIKEIIINSGITEIGSENFYECKEVRKVSFPETIINIWNASFAYCEKLEEITIPKSTKYIGNGAFVCCESLSKVIIQGAEEINSYAFAQNRKLTSVKFEAWPEKIGEQTFADAALRSIIVPEGAVRIGTQMFYDMGGDYAGQTLEEVILPDSVEYIGQWAFDFNNIEHIRLPKNLKELSGFGRSFKLKNIDIPDKVTKIYGQCFWNTPLEEILIPNSVNEMEENTFYQCENLREIRVDKEYKTLPGEPWGAPNATVIWLRAASELEIVSFPDKMTYYIGDSLDISGLVIKAIRYNGTSELVEGYECDVETASFTESGEKPVRLTYEGVSTEFTVTVLADYTVRFVDWNGTVLSVQTVHQGLSAEAPSPPGREGYAFTGWDKGFSNVQSDLTVTAQYRILVYTVTFIGMNGDILEEQRVEHGQSASAPEAPSVSGYEFTGWDTEYADIRSNLTVTAQYKMLPSVGIRISSYPDKIYYKIGEKLDTAGLKIVAITSNGTERPVSGYECNGFDSSTAGRKEVRVVYLEELDEELSQAFFAEFPVQVTEMGDNPFEKEPIHTEVRVHWPGGEFTDLTNADMAQNSVTLRESLCSAEYFIFGGCESNQLSFRTNSRQFLAENTKIDDTGIEVYLKCEETEIKIFTGIIRSSVRQKSLIEREIIAYDKLYTYRNTNISWWYKNQTTDKNMLLTQKQFRNALFQYMGIEQVQTELPYDSALVPNINIPDEMNAVAILKDLCLQNSVFGWMNREGRFEYLKLPENARLASQEVNGKENYEYYPAVIYCDTYKNFKFDEGRIWYPKTFLTEPYPGVFSSGEPTAQEAYEKNVYYNRNSFFVGDEDWLDSAFQGNEYGIYTVMEPIMPICYGTTTKWDNQHIYMAQGYELEPVWGNPLNRVGDTIEITARKTAEDGTELVWTVNSYIMTRTMRITCDGGISEKYSAGNAPYNGNNTQAGRKTQELSERMFTMRSESPTISYAEFTDGAAPFSDTEEPRKTRLRCMKRMKKAEYDALAAAGGTRFDTLYFTFEE